MIHISPRRVTTMRRFSGSARMPLASSTMPSGTGNGVRAQYFPSRATSSLDGFAKRSAEDGLLTCAKTGEAPARASKAARREEERRFIAALPDEGKVDRDIERVLGDANDELLP